MRKRQDALIEALSLLVKPKCNGLPCSTKQQHHPYRATIPLRKVVLQSLEWDGLSSCPFKFFLAEQMKTSLSRAVYSILFPFFRFSWSFLCFENKANYKQLAWKEQRQANDADRTNQFRIKQSINGIKINEYDNALLMSGVFPKRTWGKSNPYKAKAEFH